MQSTTKRTLPLPFFGARVKPLSSPSHCPRRRCCLSSLFHHPYTSSSSKAEDFRGINTPLGPTTLPAWLFSIRNCRHSAVTVRSKWLFISVHTWRQVQPLLSVPAFLYLSFFPSLSLCDVRPSFEEEVGKDGRKSVVRMSFANVAHHYIPAGREKQTWRPDFFFFFTLNPLDPIGKKGGTA